MSLHRYPQRLLFLTTLSSGLVLVAGGTVAVHLARDQARKAEELGENIGSRRAASNLEEAVVELLRRHQLGEDDVGELHDRIDRRIGQIEDRADKPEERQLTAGIAEGFREYRHAWAARPPGEAGRAEPVRLLRAGVLPGCRDLRNLNATLIEESETDLRRSLRRTAWGLAVVGVLGSLAGLVFGYGLARSLRRTIHQFLVRVQGASDLLGQELTTVEWRRAGGRPGDGADDLLRRVEQAVRKLQQNEREARHNDRLAAMGQLAAGVAHEIRNPLMAAILLLETARRDPAAGGLSDDELGMIEAELLRIERSLKTFLDFARPPRLARARVDLAAVARGALSLARGRADRQRVTVALAAPPGGCPLDGDADQLRQVLLNLLLNALDVMPDGGTLTVAVTRAAGEARLTVADTGPGISASIRPQLFEPFATTKETGVGLGLVVSRRIVEGHGGRLTAADGAAGGAVFAVTLPAGAYDD